MKKVQTHPYTYGYHIDSCHTSDDVFVTGSITDRVPLPITLFIGENKRKFACLSKGGVKDLIQALLAVL